MYALPIKAPANHFIFNDNSIRQYHDYPALDEKSQEYLMDQSDEPIEDEFEGWRGGEREVLRAKFNQNLGCTYHAYSSYTHSSERYPLPALATLGQGLPALIDEPQYEDKIEEGDSDEEDLASSPIDEALKFIEQIE